MTKPTFEVLSESTNDSDGWTFERTDRRTDRRTDGRMDRRIEQFRTAGRNIFAWSENFQTARWKIFERMQGQTQKFRSVTDGSQFHVQMDLNFMFRSTSMSCPDRPQFHMQIDFNFTCNSTSTSCPDLLNFTCTSTSISRADRPQLHVLIDLHPFDVQIDFNFTFRSTSISRPHRPQLHIQIDLGSKLVQLIFSLISGSVVVVVVQWIRRT